MTIVYWKDFDNDFTKANNGDVLTMTNEGAIVNSLTNIFETFQGSRRMVPEFALPIYRLLFEPIDEETAAILGNAILEAIERWETRIDVENVNVAANEDNNQYTVTLTYTILLDLEVDDISRQFTGILRAI